MTATGGREADVGELDNETLLRAVERFAQLLAEGGMPRMAARVYAYLLIEPVDGYTAGELATQLRVSPAGISGAVRYLVQSGLLVKEREPGVRGDHYRLHNDIWYETYIQRLDLLKRWEDLLAETIQLVGVDNAGTSLRETHAFLAFLRSELPDMLERWRENKDELVARVWADT